jgi:hypothetical protein
LNYVKNDSKWNPDEVEHKLEKRELRRRQYLLKGAMSSSQLNQKTEEMLTL